MKAVNLLPEKLRPRESAGRSGGAYIVLGVLGAVLVAATLWVLSANQVTSARSETATAKAETERADARAGALASFGSFKAIKATRLASVQQLAGERFDWERLTRELGVLVPARVWLQSVDATNPGAGGDAAAAPASGGTPSAAPAGGATAAGEEGGPAATLAGCAASQRDLAKLMVRLRRLNQATDVELVTSERGEAADTGGAGGAPAPTAPPAASGGAPVAAGSDDCGVTDGKPNYTFEVSVTLEKPTPSSDPTDARVPVVLGGGA